MPKKRRPHTAAFALFLRSLKEQSCLRFPLPFKAFRMTIYRIYNENGCRAGFWVQHRRWKDWCAQVQSVAGKSDGPLPGQAPFHDDAPIEFRWFDIRSGRQIADRPMPEDLHDKNFTTIA